MKRNKKRSLPYRKGVGVVLLNKKNEIFVGKRIDNEEFDAWQMPQGGINKNETPIKAAFRELKEETGVMKKDVKILSVSKNWLYYDLPKNLIKKVFKGKYKGQKQKWYIMRFYGKNHKINIQTENPEFQNWKWTPSRKLKNIIVSFKKKLYREILKEFEGIIGR